MKVEFESTFKRALSEGINLVLGAGFSVLAKDMEGKPLPLGSTLAAELTTEFKLPQLEGLPLI